MRRSTINRLTIAGLVLLLGIASAPARLLAASAPTVPSAPSTDASHASPASPRGTITMDFRDADINSVLAFLSMAGGVTVIKDPAITGKITVIAPSELTFDDALALLNSILKTRGATVVRTDNLVQVVPNDKAGSASAVRVGAEVGDVPAGDQIVTQIIPLKRLKAADIQKQLQPLFASGSAVAADEQTNTLIITDFASHIRRVLEILGDLEQQQKNVEAAKEKQAARQTDAQKDKTGKLKDLLAAGGAAALKEAKIDVKVIPLRFAPARQLADELSRILNAPQAPIPQSLLSTVQKLAAGDAKRAEALLRVLQTQPGTSPTPAGQAFPRAAADGSPQGALIPNRVVADTYTNSLVVTGTADVVRTIEQLVAQLDQAQLATEPQYVTFVRPLKYGDAASVANTLNSLFAGLAKKLPRSLPAQGAPAPMPTPTTATAPSATAEPGKTADLPLTDTQKQRLKKLLDAVGQRAAAPDSEATATSSSAAAPGLSAGAPGSAPDPAVGLGSLQLQLAEAPIIVVADAGTNSLVITTIAEVRQELENLITGLDKEDSGQVKVSFLYRLQYADATNLATVLNRFYASGAATGAAGPAGLAKSGRSAAKAKAVPAPAPAQTPAQKNWKTNASRVAIKRALPRAAAVPGPANEVQVVADKDSNTLLVVATSAAVNDVKTTIAALDQPGSADSYATRFFPLAHADASQLAKTLGQLFAGAGRDAFPLSNLNLEETAATPAKEARLDNIVRFVRLVAEPGTNSLVVIAPAGMMEDISALISRIDAQTPPSEPDYATFVRPLQYADADRVANILSGLFNGFAKQLPRQPGDRAAVGKPGQTPSKQSTAPKKAVQTSRPGDISDLKLNSAQKEAFQRLLAASNKAATGSAGFSAGAKALQLQLADAPIAVVADTWTNSLVITTVVEVKDQLEALIGELDKEDPDQVRVGFLYQLRFADATNLATVLNRFYSSAPAPNGANGRPVVGSDVQAVADKGSNTLLIVAAAGAIDDVKTTIATLDQPASSDAYATQVFTLANADAADLAKTLTQLFAGTGRGAFPLSSLGLQGAPGQGAVLDNANHFVRIVAEPGTNSVVVIAPAGMMGDIAALISRFDAQTPSTDLKTVVYPLQYADSTALAKTLADFFAGAARITGQKAALPAPVVSSPEARAAWERLKSYMAAKQGQQPGQQLGQKPPQQPQQGAAGSGAATAPADQGAKQGGGTGVSPAASLSRAPQASGTRSTAGMVWIVAEPATNSLLVTAPADTIADVETLIQELDHESPINSETGMTVYALQNASATVLANLMNALFGDGGGKPQSQPAGANAARTRSSSQSSVANGGEAKFVPDSATNSLIITASPFLMGDIRAMLAELDAQPAQVLIEAKVVEVSLDKNDAFGAEWTWLNSDSGKSLTLGGNLANILPGTDFKFSILSGDVQVALQALGQQAKLNVLSTPRILAVNNTPASIVIGDQVPYLQSTKKDPAGNELNYYGYRDVGISLRVTPRIGESGNVYLDLAQQIDNLNKDVVAVNGAPIVSTRQAETSVVVKDGQTMVIGGLLRDNTSESVHKVPLLGDLPILGQLFRSTDTITQKTELLIFITPHIVRSAEENTAPSSAPPPEGTK